jgi:signal transduction histidine kinase/CheY-like chemotaxis protein
MKIRSHLGLMAAVVLVPVVLLLGYAIASSLDAERNSYLRSMREAARSTSLASDREWSYATGSAMALRQSKLLAAGDLSGFYRQCKETNAGTEINTVLLDAGGRQLFNTARPYGIAIAEPTDAVRSRIKSVTSGGKPVVSNLIVGRATGKNVVTLEFPLVFPDDRTYVLSQWFNAEHLKTAFPTKAIPPQWLSAIFDRDGRTILRSQGPAEYIGQMPKEDLRAAILDKQVLQMRNITRDGIAVYTVFDRSTVTGWTVAVGVPVELVEESARRAVLLMSVALIAALAFSVTAVYFLGKRLVSNIESAKNSAVLLGRHQTPPLINSPITEVDELHDALHRVGGILQQYQSEQGTLLEQTREAQRRAEQQNNAKDDFLAMLGHELRNPLSTITAGVALISAPTISDTSRIRALEAIKRQSGLLTNIVDELLDASRIINGKVTLSKKTIDLAVIAKACMEAIALRGFGETHHIEVCVSSCLVEADQVRLSQVIGNILENAFKFTPSGGTVRMRAIRGADQAVLEISDTGVGINAELLSRVFEVFVQGPNRLDRAKGGLGIGLSVVNAMVTLHGGTVIAESDGPGKGSRFTVRLPLASGEMEVGSALEQQPVSGCFRGTSKILLIDDNDDARHMLRELLLDAGLDVLEACTGQAGLDALADPSISTAVVDIGLPDLTGYEIAMRVRDQHATRHLCLIALTGYGQDADRVKAMEAGFDIFMTKPVQFEQLLANLKF